MGKLVRLADEKRRRAEPVCFTRAEINHLLALYSRRVRKGEWRDYAIRLAPGMASFIVFKSAMERPLYTISKFRPGQLGPGGDFLVAQGAQRLMQAARLDEVVSRLDKQPKLVRAQ